MSKTTARMRFMTTVAAGAVALVGLSAPAFAQDAPEGEAGSANEIIVSALRRDQRLQDVPAAVSAISAETLKSSNITAIGEALKQVPNLQVATPYGEGGPPSFTIRGITATVRNVNVSKPIALYEDDVVRDFQTFEIIPAYDIERMEVLRGPQGALYGRNATGGTVKIITAAPKFENSGSLTLGYGSYNERQIQATGNAELVDNVLAVRVATLYQKNDGYLKNLIPGVKDGAQLDMFAVRAGIHFQPSSSFDAVLRFEHVNSGGRPSAGAVLNFQQLGTGWPSTVENLPGMSSREGIGFWEDTVGDYGIQKNKWDGVHLNMTWSPSDQFEISSVTAYDWGSNRYAVHPGAFPIDLTYIDTTAKMDQFFQELRVASKFDGPFNFIVGGNYIKTNIDNVGYYTGNFDPGLAADFYNFFPYSGELSHGQKRNGQSVFASLNYEVTDALTLHGGVRWNRDFLKAPYFNGSASFYVDGTGFHSGPPTDPYWYYFFQDEMRKKTFHKTTFEAGADYKITDDIMVYASFNQGYRAGQLNGGAATDIRQVYIIPPEASEAFEVGIKTTLFDNMLTFNVSAATTDYKDQQTSVIDTSTTPPVRNLASIAKARIRSLEVEASLRPADGFLFYGNLGLADPKYTDGTITGIAGSTGQTVTGNQMVEASKVTATLGTSIDVAKIDDGVLTFRADANYASKRYFDIFNNPRFQQDGYWLVNASLGYKLEHLSINASVRNLFNEKYYANISATSERGLIRFDSGQRGAPRQVMITGTYSF